MRIAVWHNLPYGGARRALFGHLQALKATGNYIEIWTTDFHPEEYLDFAEFGKVHVIKARNRKNGYHGPYKNPVSISETKSIIEDLKIIQRKCANEINSLGFDLAFVNSCSVSYMPFIAEFLKIPSVLYLGEPYRWLYEANPENVWQANPYKFLAIGRKLADYKKIYSKRIQVRQEIESAKSYSKILVNSFYSKESVLKAYGIEPQVCKLGVNTSMFTYNGAAEKADHVVGIGVLYAPKGPDRAIYLLSKLKEQVRPKLYWICNGVDETYLAWIKAYAKEKNVAFIPLIKITDHELVNIVSTARFMIYTSRLEPLGLAPLEANACGTFVIGIAEGGVRETISHQQNGFLISDMQDDKFVEYAEVLLTDKNMAVNLGLQAREFVVNNWSFEHLKLNINTAIKSVLN